MNPVVIRDARPADDDAVRDVFRRASLTNERDRAHLLAHPDALEWTPDEGREPHIRVAVVDDRVVGFATTTTAAENLELDDLFVDPDWMVRGIGRMLVEDVFTFARRRGIERIGVTANDHAVGFYERLGFVTGGVVETRFGPAPRMHCDHAEGGAWPARPSKARATR